MEYYGYEKSDEVEVGDNVIVKYFHSGTPVEMAEEFKNTVQRVRAIYPQSYCMINEILIEGSGYYVTHWEKYFDPYFWDVD